MPRSIFMRKIIKIMYKNTIYVKGFVFLFIWGIEFLNENKKPES